MFALGLVSHIVHEEPQHSLAFALTHTVAPEYFFFQYTVYIIINIIIIIYIFYYHYYGYIVININTILAIIIIIIIIGYGVVPLTSTFFSLFFERLFLKKFELRVLLRLQCL
jgi:hypothetical protein